MKCNTDRTCLFQKFVSMPREVSGQIILFGVSSALLMNTLACSASLAKCHNANDPDKSNRAETLADKHPEWFFELRNRIATATSANSSLKGRVRCNFQLEPDGKFSIICIKAPFDMLGTVDPKDANAAVKILNSAMARPLTSKLPETTALVWTDLSAKPKYSQVWTNP
jgi:hypothetical protein